MHKFFRPEDLPGKLNNKRTLYEIIDNMLFLIYFKWDTTFLNLRVKLLNLRKKCLQRQVSF